VQLFDLRGPEFLALYVGLLAAGIVAALVVRHFLRGPTSHVDVPALRLEPLEVALLAEGDQHALKTALAGLAHRELITVETTTRKMRARGRPAGVARSEERLHTVMGDVGKTFEQIASVAGSVVEPARRRLQGLGLLVADDERWKLRLTPVIVLGFVLAIGLFKINVGVERGRPVRNLTVLCWVTVAAIVVLVVKAPHRSRRGDAALRLLRSRNMGLRQTVVAKPSRVAPDDLSLAVALYGASVLQTGPLVALRDALRPPPSTDSSSGSSSCSSGGGCGGGCGGGGCGGCGS
jgi:uncharacterized protein (TIGR04222 family)